MSMTMIRSGATCQPRPTRRAGGFALRGGALLIIAVTAGCADFSFRQELGIVGEGPDPFTVVRNKSLEMPTDMTELPTPAPGAPSRVAPTPAEDAQRALTGGPIVTSSAPSAAEAALLRNASADGVDDSIRTEIAQDGEDGEGRLLDGLLGTDDPSVEPLDAAEEARRLAAEARAGKNPDLVVPQEE